jgi:prolipoprotein diacylglyceryltransferase
MYPNFAYLLNDNRFAPIQTFGFFLFLCFLLTALLTFREIQKIYPQVATTFIDYCYLMVYLAGATLIGCQFFALMECASIKTIHLNFLGSLVGCCLAAYPFCVYKKMNYLITIEQAMYPLSLGYAIGRMGCHLSGDGDWGIPHIAIKPSHWLLPDILWAYDYPHNVLNKGALITGCAGKYCHFLEFPVYPTSLYESGVSLFIGILIWFLKQKKRVPIGGLLGVFLLLQGTTRFLIEDIKCNPKYFIAGYELSQAQIISLVMIAVSFFFIYKSYFLRAIFRKQI